MDLRRWDFIMSRKNKYTVEQKVKACEEYLYGSKSAVQIAHDLHMGDNGSIIVMKWAKNYKMNGATIFLPSNKNTHYSKEFKLLVVQEYLTGNISLLELSCKYKIKSAETVRKWISKYNRHEELEDYLPKPEVYKMKNRKTTIEERMEIVKWCDEHGNNYKEAASMFNCSYTQVYNWVKKYRLDGQDGLIDRRGQHKLEEELSSEERLKRENDKLTRQNEELQRQIILLKKLNAFEWKD